MDEKYISSPHRKRQLNYGESFRWLRRGSLISWFTEMKNMYVFVKCDFGEPLILMFRSTPYGKRIHIMSPSVMLYTSSMAVTLRSLNESSAISITWIQNCIWLPNILFNLMQILRSMAIQPTCVITSLPSLELIPNANYRSKEQSETGVQVILVVLQMMVVTTMNTTTGKTVATVKPCKSGRSPSFDSTFIKDFSGVPRKPKKSPVTSSSSTCSTSQSLPHLAIQLLKTQPARNYSILRSPSSSCGNSGRILPKASAGSMKTTWYEDSKFFSCWPVSWAWRSISWAAGTRHIRLWSLSTLPLAGSAASSSSAWPG